MSCMENILDDVFTKVFGEVFTGAAEMPRHDRIGRARRIVKQEAEKAGVCREDIFADDRTRQAIIARHSVMHRLRVELGWSLGQIGQHLGRDHTTILHGIRAHKRRMKEEGNA